VHLDPSATAPHLQNAPRVHLAPRSPSRARPHAYCVAGARSSRSRVEHHAPHASLELLRMSLDRPVVTIVHLAAHKVPTASRIVCSANLVNTHNFLVRLYVRHVRSAVPWISRARVPVSIVSLAVARHLLPCVHAWTVCPVHMPSTSDLAAVLIASQENMHRQPVRVCALRVLQVLTNRIRASPRVCPVALARSVPLVALYVTFVMKERWHQYKARQIANSVQSVPHPIRSARAAIVQSAQ
jgi:hypothetical protein